MSASAPQREQRPATASRPLTVAGWAAELEHLDPGGEQTRLAATAGLPIWRAHGGVPFRPGRWLAGVRWHGLDPEQLRGALAQAYATELDAARDLIGPHESHARTWQRVLVAFRPSRSTLRRLRPAPDGGWLPLEVPSARDRLIRATGVRVWRSREAYVWRWLRDEGGTRAGVGNLLFRLAEFRAGEQTLPATAAANRALKRAGLLTVDALDDEPAEPAELADAPEPERTAQHERTDWLDPPPQLLTLTDVVLTAAPPLARVRATATA